MEITWTFKDGTPQPPGVMVTVNNHKMHVYTQGDGADTLVFLSGGGTCCPTLDFKPLWALLCARCKVAIVERAGYGWSDTACVSRDIATVLDETRAALTVAKVQPPYVLVPHSLSGLEALAWAQRFPGEVKAIVGLDAAIPLFYQQLTPVKAAAITFLQYTASIAARLGLLRLIAGGAEKSIRSCGQFSGQEIGIYKHMFLHHSFTQNMLDEGKLCRKNAEEVARMGYPQSVPYLSFISDGKKTGVASWRALLIAFVAQLRYGSYVTLDCGHYLHYHQPEKIARETEKFVASL